MSYAQSALLLSAKTPDNTRTDRHLPKVDFVCPGVIVESLAKIFQAEKKNAKISKFIYALNA